MALSLDRNIYAQQLIQTQPLADSTDMTIPTSVKEQNKLQAAKKLYA